jgi:AcrR family transcriptional regulator
VEPLAGEDLRTDKSVEKILDGTMRLLSRQGTRKLSVSDICAASGVARGTFYRYFSTKEDVLDALGRHLEDGIAARFATAIEANPDPKQRVRIVLDEILAHRTMDGFDFTGMLDVAPQFTLEFIAETFPKLVDVVTDALGPALDQSPPVASGALTRHQLGDLFLRVVNSMLILPVSRADQVPELVEALFRVPTTAARKRKPPTKSKATTKAKAKTNAKTKAG